MYDRKIHDAIIDSFNVILFESVPDAHGLASLHVRIDEVDDAMFYFNLMVNNNMGTVEVAESAKFWVKLCRINADLHVNIKARLVHHYLTILWLEYITVGCKLCDLRLQMRLVLHFNMRRGSDLFGMLTYFEKYMRSTVSYLTTSLDLSRFQGMEMGLLDTSIKDFVATLNLAKKLHVSFVCPTRSHIPDIKEKILKDATDGSVYSFMLKHLILGGHIVIHQTEPTRMRLEQTRDGKWKRKIQHDEDHTIT